jgi:Flp pilus assembly protein protease CpaA
MGYFSWAEFTKLESIIGIILIAICLIAYLILIVQDIRKQEIDTKFMIITIVANFILPIIFTAKFRCIKISIILGIGLLLWFILFLLDDKFNHETVIGSADIDMFTSQAIITLSEIIWVIIKVNKIKEIVILYLIQNFFTFLLYGLTPLALVFLIVKLVEKIKTKKTFKEVMKKHNVPTCIAFLPLIIGNLYIVLAI